MSPAKSIVMDKWQEKSFEDFSLEQEFCHTPPFMLTEGHISLYGTVFGAHFPVTSSDQFAMAAGYARAPIEDMMIFQCVSGRVEADFASCSTGEFHYRNICFYRPTYPGYTLTTRSKVVSLEDQQGQINGLVRLQTEVINLYNKPVLTYEHVMPVRKREPEKLCGTQTSRDFLAGKSLKHVQTPHELGSGCPEINRRDWPSHLAGCPRRWRDYTIGMKMDHGMCCDLDEQDHRLAFKLFTAPLASLQKQDSKYAAVSSRFLLSLIRSESYRGLRNAFHITRIQNFQSVLSCPFGEKLHVWSEVQEKKRSEKRDDVGLLRLKTFAGKNISLFPKEMASDNEGAQTPDSVSVLPLEEKNLVFVCDYWVVVPM